MQPLATLAVLALELLLAAGLGLALVTVGLGGAAWVVGGIAAGAIGFSLYPACTNRRLQPNRRARKIGQLIIGLSIGLSLQPSHLETLATQLPVFLGLPVFLMLAGAGIGFLYARLEQVDLLTALLATTPGNIGVMATIAADYSRSAALVSLVQLLRFTTVICLMPLICHLSAASPPPVALGEWLQQVRSVTLLQLGLTAGSLAIAAAVSRLGNLLKIPLAGFLGAIGVGLLGNGLPLLGLMPLNFQLPLGLVIVGQILLGITIGEYWGLNPRIAPRAIVRAAIPVGQTLVAALAAAVLIHAVTAWNWLTCLLVTAPGGSPEMIWLAVMLHQDTEIVTAGHLVRLLAINLSLPLLVSLAGAGEQPRSTPPAATQSELN